MLCWLLISTTLLPSQQEEVLRSEIERLASDRVEEREDASRRIIALGGKAIPVLVKALSSGEQELRARATAVLKEIGQRNLGQLVELYQCDSESDHRLTPLVAEVIQHTAGRYLAPGYCKLAFSQVLKREFQTRFISSGYSTAGGRAVAVRCLVVEKDDRFTLVEFSYSFPKGFQENGWPREGVGVTLALELPGPTGKACVSLIDEVLNCQIVLPNDEFPVPLGSLHFWAGLYVPGRPIEHISAYVGGVNGKREPEYLREKAVGDILNEMFNLRRASAQKVDALPEVIEHLACHVSRVISHQDSVWCVETLTRASLFLGSDAALRALLTSASQAPDDANPAKEVVLRLLGNNLQMLTSEALVSPAGRETLRSEIASRLSGR